MKEENISRYLNSFRKPMIIFGVILAGTGGLILFYLGLLVLQVVNSPEEVKIVELVLAHINSDGAAIFGEIGEKKIDINFSESVRLFAFLTLGVWILAALAGIVRILISAGISIIKFAATEINEDDKKHASNKWSQRDESGG